MKPTAPFLRAAGLAGILAAAITGLIIVLPSTYGGDGSIETRLALQDEPLYRIDQWLRYLNVFAILAVSWGVAAHRLERSPGAASSGMLFLLFYGAAELLGRSAMIVTRDGRWMRAAAAADGDARTELLSMVEAFDAVWAGWFVLILMAFTMSALLLGWAMRGGSGLQRAACAGLFAAAGIGAVTFAAPYVAFLRPIASAGYVIVQPTSRLLMGLFLLDEARRAARPEHPAR